MKLKILKNPDPSLRQKTIKVKDPLSKDVQDLVSNMLETMRTSNGVGLAATQVGCNLRVCVVQTEDIKYVLINPQITARSKDKIISEEGCLSFPGKFFPIARHSEVQVRYLDEHGKPSKVKGRDLLARAFQHEIDHLDGILIIDRIKKNRKPSTKIQATKIIKKKA